MVHDVCDVCGLGQKNGGPLRGRVITDERAIAKIVFAALEEYAQFVRLENPGMRVRVERAEQIAYRTAQEILTEN